MKGSKNFPKVSPERFAKARESIRRIRMVEPDYTEEIVQKLNEAIELAKKKSGKVSPTLK
jgi:hypothetical protein